MQTNNVTEVWSAPAKVNTFQELDKLVPINANEVLQELAQEKKMSKKELVRAALEYSIAHPSESIVSIAKLYGIADTALYNARFLHKKRLEKGSKKAKPQWKTISVATSNESFKAKLADAVNHPAHYKTGGIETIDFIEAKQLTYNLGNVVKYITRAGVKNKATHIEDLEKAAWYLNREINNLKGGA